MTLTFADDPTATDETAAELNSHCVLIHSDPRHDRIVLPPAHTHGLPNLIRLKKVWVLFSTLAGGPDNGTGLNCTHLIYFYLSKTNWLRSQARVAATKNGPPRSAATPIDQTLSITATIAWEKNKTKPKQLKCVCLTVSSEWIHFKHTRVLMPSERITCSMICFPNCS